jgi:xanthine dehydrogenase molybdopterin-binding subunit B
MERIAKYLKKDPLEIKLLNMEKQDSPLPNLVADLQRNSDYVARRAAVDTFNQVNYL